METYIASSTDLGASVGGALFNGGFSMLNEVLPYVIAVAILWFGFGILRRVFGGT